MKNIVLLGASGSIGQQTLDIVQRHSEDFSIVALSVGKRVDLLDKMIEDFKPIAVCVQELSDYNSFKLKYPLISWHYGDEGLVKLAMMKEANLLVNALVGFVGLLPTIEGIKSGKDIALANKESLVVAGNFINDLVKTYQVALIPIDSEHSAILQCLHGYPNSEVDKLVLTASGGSFRDKTRAELVDVSATEALAHPNWSMGAKITIDSATMMNKAFEVIECYHFFKVKGEQIEVLIHPQSVVHSMVKFIDGAYLAQLGDCDMRLPIQFALSYPKRLTLPKNDDFSLTSLNFEPIDEERFPFIKLAYEVIRLGDGAGCVVNAANEVCVAAFLAGKIKFLEIESIVFSVFESFKNSQVNDLKDLFKLNQEVREATLKYFN